MIGVSEEDWAKIRLSADSECAAPHDKYQSLHDVLHEAFVQASAGKGAERHGNGLPFDEQPMQVISDLLDSDAGMLFQAIKKLQEGSRMQPAAARREYLGAINYIAGVIVRMDRNNV